MAFRNFIYTEYNKDLVFLPKEPSSGFGTGSSSVSANTEPLKSNEEPEIQPAEVTADFGGSPKPELFIVHPGSVAARIKDRKFKTRGGSSRPHVKRKLASGSSTSRATLAKTSSSKDDAPFLTVSNDDEGLPDVHELKDATAFDNAVNRRSRELLQVIEKLRGEYDVMRSRKRAREEECKGLQVKCEDAMTKFEKNPAVVALQEKIFVLSTEVKEHKLNLDRMMLESQNLIGKLVSSAIVYGRCRAFKHVADMKEPFDLSKVKGYRSSYKKDHTQASRDLDTTTFPYLKGGMYPLNNLLLSRLRPLDNLILTMGYVGHEKDYVTFNPLQRSAKIPSQKCFSSFELIVRGTPNLHTTYSHTNLSGCLPFITVRGFASTHFMECSMAIAKNLKPSRAIGKGPRMLNPQ
ncbi:hypothetical protein Tco_1053986 [Tanacetum coccineum]|uniref:Uncharacterized protein n=1 Tax=Tanacetum coccineum TaxID=301880 RepID=A0ABQ5GVX7_9ASTR